MKLIHTSDIHLASPLTSRLPAAKVARRGREIFETFSKICSSAAGLGAEAVIIAGDLFDSTRVTAKMLDSVLSVFERCPELIFFYLPGNHERDVLLSCGRALPKNLKIFGKEWTYFEYRGVVFAGRCETSADMFSTLSISPDERNVVVLHGELRERCAEGGIIGLKDAQRKGIDYLALGHYHTYSAREIDIRGIAVYSGTPEGRGFDEVGELGFSLVDVSEAGVKQRFVPSASRRLLIKGVDITGAARTSEIIERIEDSIRGIGSENILRVVLTGSRELELRYDLHIITAAIAERFFYFEVKDETRLITRCEDYRHDKSLKGEFIRLCLAEEGLSDEEKSRIIHCGLSALAGEAFDE